MTVENTNKASQIGLLISYYIVLSFWSAQTLGLSMISRNIAGQTKKATVVAANFIAWAVGNSIGMYCPPTFPNSYYISLLPYLKIQYPSNNPFSITTGPQVFLKWDEPRYFIAFAVHISCYSVLVVVIFVLRWHLKRENAKKDAIALVDTNLVHAFDDLTDRENPNFRYIY